MKVILPITPQTNVRTTQGDSIFFRIPFDQLKPAGRRRRLRIERYNQYKEDLRALVLEKKLSFPAIGAGLMFYFPMPVRWSKKKKALMHLQFHQQKPDVDNILKGFLDSIFAEDKRVAHLSELGKKWVDSPNGWIEVTLPEPGKGSIARPLLEAVVQEDKPVVRRPRKSQGRLFIDDSVPNQLNASDFQQLLQEGKIKVK